MNLQQLAEKMNPEMKNLWPPDLFICPNCYRDQTKSKHIFDNLNNQVVCPPVEPDWNS